MLVADTGVAMDKTSRLQTYELLPFTDASASKTASAETLKGDEPKQSRLRKWRTGWKFTLFLSSVACVLVLTFNTGMLLWAVARDRVHDAKGVLTTGDCDRVSRLNTGLHLLINVFSTILLAASNHGMQCLCAPTRKDVDRVHHYGGWLHIGVPSIKNLGHVSGRRAFLWLCLLVSSVPLHLLYNSTVFYTTSAYGYDVFVGRESPVGKSLGALGSPSQGTFFARFRAAAQNGSLEDLTASECFNAYDTTYQANYGTLILLSDDVQNRSDYYWVTTEDVYTPMKDQYPHNWMCWPDLETCSAAEAARGQWTLRGYTISSCLSQRVPQYCRLQYSLPLTIVVIVANLVKAIVLCYMSFSQSDPPMLTTGDAVASFLNKPDTFTVGRCLLSARDVRDLAYSSDKHRYKPLSFQGDRRKWYASVQQREWVSILLFWAIALGLCTGLLIYAQDNDGSEIWSAQFGKTSNVTSNNLIKGSNWPTSLIKNTIIANIPQLIFSLLYFCSNSLLSAMTLASEWSRYALAQYHHRGLRVSWNPQGAQRPSYFLSLPYRYAVPLMAASATLHWLISQSIFLVGVDAYDESWERVPYLDVMTCGYTPIAIVSAIAVGAAMLLAILALACRRLDSEMVVAGSCSLAIAAACHPRYDPNSEQAGEAPGGMEAGMDAARMEYLPLRWGAVCSVDGEVGHCAFTSEDVEMPQAGRVYQ
ncbi:hypothetical protein BJX65DRAFT_17229 [Aspergillus insuetus]